MSDSIVAVGAHAADMEFTAGATLLKHVRNGWEGHIVHLTLGEKGHAKLSADEYGTQKQREAEDAARLLNVTPHFFPFADGVTHSYSRHSNRRRPCRSVRRGSLEDASD